MEEYGIRDAKARLSHIVRSASAGVCTIVTDNRTPVAMIGPLPATRAEGPPQVGEAPKSALRRRRVSRRAPERQFPSNSTSDVIPRVKISTWLIDSALLKMSGTPNPTALHKWCEANKPSLFLSNISIILIAAGFEKTAKGQPERRKAPHDWLDGLTFNFGSHIHEVDHDLLRSAGAILPQLTTGQSRHRLHDCNPHRHRQSARHKLLTRRDVAFAPHMQGDLEVI